MSLRPKVGSSAPDASPEATPVGAAGQSLNLHLAAEHRDVARHFDEWAELAARDGDSDAAQSYRLMAVQRREKARLLERAH